MGVIKKRISSDLDNKIKLFGYKGWVLFLALLSLLIIGLLWSIFGSTYQRVYGMGVILPKSSKTYKAVSLGTGQLIKIKIKSGDYVNKNQIIAETDQKNLYKKIELLTEKLSQYLEMEAESYSYIEYFKMINNTKAEKLNDSYNIRKKNIQEHREHLAALVKASESLRLKKFISNHNFQKLKNNWSDVVFSEDKLGVNLLEVKLKEITDSHTFYKDIIDIQIKIIEIIGELDKLYQEYNLYKYIRSPISGTIGEVRASEGEYIGSGKIIAIVNSKGNGRKVIAFFSPYDGKKINKDMKAFIIPSVVKKEEFGSIIGEVSSVMPYPLTLEASNILINNIDLTKLLTKNMGTSIVANIKLSLDSKTESRLKWTSKKGPKFHITDGTIANVSIVVKEEPPIVLALKFLRGIFNEG